MTFKIRMLAAAGAIALPTALAAQTTNPEMQPPTPNPSTTVPETQTPEPGMQMPTPDNQQPADQTTPGSQAPGQAGATTAATAADIQTGATVHDTQGGTVGTIESADASGAVVNTGTARARLPISSFARNGSGLVIAMTKAQLEAAAQPQSPPQNPS